MSAPLLEALDLRVQRGVQLLLDVPRLAVTAGEVLAVLGPNGAGKSTLLRCLAFLEQPAAGLIRFEGQTLAAKDALAYRRRTAVLFQEPLLFDTTVFENVATGLRLRGVHRQEVRKRVMRWLERLGIAPLAQRSARTLSSGEARRVSLARALAPEPELLFLDEPFTALDTPTRAAFICDLAELLNARQMTTIFVTHDQAEARALADRVAILLAGKIAQLDTPDSVFDRPAEGSVAAFLHSEQLPRNRLAVRVTQQPGASSAAPVDS